MTDSVGNPLIEIDGVDMRTQAYNAATRTGRYSMPGRRGEDLVLAGRSGYSFVANKPYDAGLGALSVWVTGANANGTIPATQTLRRTSFETNMSLFQRLFTRRHKLSTLRAAQPDGTIRRAFVQWQEWGEPSVQAGGTRAEWSIGYTIPAVFWEDESTSSQDSAVGATLPKNLDLSTFANMTGVIEDSVITVTGAITNPRVTDAETGAYVQYTGTVASAQTWVINVANSTSVVNAVSQLANTTHTGGYLFLVIPNIFGASSTPRLVLSGTSGNANTKLNVVARRKWVNG
jgi:hypothetical protein